jgi:DNA modification methylase
MKKIPDKAIHFICADLPYNISGKGGLTMRGNTVPERSGVPRLRLQSLR